MNGPKKDIMFQACKDGNLEEVKRLIKIDYSSFQGSTNTLVIWAGLHGQEEVANYLKLVQKMRDLEV